MNTPKPSSSPKAPTTVRVTVGHLILFVLGIALVVTTLVWLGANLWRALFDVTTWTAMAAFLAASLDLVATIAPTILVALFIGAPYYWDVLPVMGKWAGRIHSSLGESRVSRFALGTAIFGASAFALSSGSVSTWYWCQSHGKTIAYGREDFPVLQSGTSSEDPSLRAISAQRCTFPPASALLASPIDVLLTTSSSTVALRAQLLGSSTSFVYARLKDHVEQPVVAVPQGDCIIRAISGWTWSRYLLILGCVVFVLSAGILYRQYSRVWASRFFTGDSGASEWVIRRRRLEWADVVSRWLRVPGLSLAVVTAFMMANATSGYGSDSRWLKMAHELSWVIDNIWVVQLYVLTTAVWLSIGFVVSRGFGDVEWRDLHRFRKRLSFSRLRQPLPAERFLDMSGILMLNKIHNHQDTLAGLVDIGVCPAMTLYRRWAEPETMRMFHRRNRSIARSVEDLINLGYVVLSGHGLRITAAGLEAIELPPRLISASMPLRFQIPLNHAHQALVHGNAQACIRLCADEVLEPFLVYAIIEMVRHGSRLRMADDEADIAKFLPRLALGKLAEHFAHCLSQNRGSGEASEDRNNTSDLNESLKRLLLVLGRLRNSHSHQRDAEESGDLRARVVEDAYYLHKLTTVFVYLTASKVL